MVKGTALPQRGQWKSGKLMPSKKAWKSGAGLTLGVSRGVIYSQGYHFLSLSAHLVAPGISSLPTADS